MGSVRSLGLTTFLITIPIGITAALLATRDPFETREIFLLWAVVGLMSQIAMGLVMFAGYSVCVRFAGRTQVIAVVVFALLAGAVRGAVVGLLGDYWGLVSTASVPVRTLSSTVIFTLWLLTLGAALHANDRYRNELSGLLRELLTSELITRSQSLAVPDSREDELPARVRAQAAAIHDALETTASASTPGASARVLKREIEERLRPLSHELWRESGTTTQLPAHRSSFLARASRTRPPLRLLILLFTIIFFLIAIVTHGLDAGLLIGAASVGAFSVVVALGYRTGATITSRRSLAIALSVLVLPSSAVAAVAFISGTALPGASLVAMAIGTLFAFAIFVVARTAVLDRSHELQELRERIDAQVLDQHIEVERYRQRASRTAGFLHNTLQARLTAAVLQLDHAASTGDPDRTQSALKNANEALALATEHPLGDLSSTAQERLNEIVDAWAGIATITITQATAPTNTSALALAVDAIEEAITNAVRHGGATEILVHIKQSPSQLIVSVRDNGHASAHSPGMGEEWMNSITAGQWSRSATDHGSELTLNLPLGSHQST
jgi:signal transduction histidine kinase